jgi:hypothetical protein
MPGSKTTNRTPAFSRRHFWKMLASACLCRAGAQQADPVLDPFRWDDPANKAERSERQYRVDAQILLFGATLFRRNGVGGGNAAWSEAGERRKLEFTGFSYPEKAAGLKRFGFIEEVSSSGKDYAYFGLMTSSPEESMDSARKALNPGSGAVAITAIDGHLRASSAEALITQFQAPASAFVHNREELVRSAHKALGEAERRPLEFDPRTTTGQPFLHALFDAYRRGANSTTYIYGSRLYSLTLHAAPDESASVAFRKAKLLPAAGKALKVSGRIKPPAGGKEIDFHIWLEVGASRPIPLRIDYRPKSYLRLTFEAAVV